MRRCYTFSVCITAEEPTDDGDGYTSEDVASLLQRTLVHYAAPLNKERRHVAVDFELMDVQDEDGVPV